MFERIAFTVVLGSIAVVALVGLFFATEPQKRVSNWPEGWECAPIVRGDVCFRGTR